ncbi:MAG: D-Ala-D-Ala carboxypeptidase family metallohydrolase [Asticcacaulis sp.]
MIRNGLHPAVADLDLTGWTWPHFRAQELACRCQGRFCEGEYFHDPVFLNALEQLRAKMARPLAINSARRCAGHNQAVGGVPGSWHTRTLAVDIGVTGWSLPARRALLAASRSLGFGGIGLARTFLHLDRRPLPASSRAVEWTYQPGGRDLWR